MKIAKKRLNDYPRYDREIRERKLAMEYREPDINASIKGGGRAGNPLEANYIKQEQDPYISNRIKWKQAVETTLDNMPEWTKPIIEVYYFENLMSMRDVAKHLNYGYSTIQRVCDKVERKLLVALGEELE